MKKIAVVIIFSIIIIGLAVAVIVIESGNSRQIDTQKSESGDSNLSQTGSGKSAVPPKNLTVDINDETVEVLVSNLGHYDVELALASLKALRGRKPPEAVPGLAKYLERPDVKERWIAVDILADISTSDAVLTIEKCAVNPKMEKTARLRAIAALGKLKVTGSRSALEKNLSDPDEQIRLVSNVLK